MPAGRPTKYDPDTMLPIINEGGGNGEGMAELIVSLGIGRETFYKWKEKYPEFSNAVSGYKIRSQSWWEGKGRDGMVGKIQGFNATAYIFNMKNRFHQDWKDKHEVENKHDVSDPMKDLLNQIGAAGKTIADD